MKKRANNLLTQQRVNSASTLPAQTATLCDPGYQLTSAITTQLAVLMNRNDLTQADKAVIEMSLLGGLRISSILRLQGKNVLNDLSCCVLQDKGSSTVIFHSVYCRDFWRMTKDYNLVPFDGLSRYYYYRLFIKLGLNKRFEGNINHSVTHLGRHIKGLVYKSQKMTEIEKQRLLGHKNIKNLQYYEKQPDKDQKRQ